MVNADEIISFLKDFSSIEYIYEDYDIFELGICGDDFHEMIDKYAIKYGVDMDDYLWYFHADEEGMPGISEVLFPPPYKRVKRIPLTPGLLAGFANKGKWGIKYPEHKIPEKRYDLMINQTLLILMLLLVILGVVMNLFD